MRGGDRDAYAELVHRHAPVAVRTASLLGAGPDAEDVVQEAFVKAYRALGRFREGAAFRPWLLQIVAERDPEPAPAAGRRGGPRAVGLAADRAAAARGRATDDPAATRAVAGAAGRAGRAGSAQLSEPHRQVVTCRYLLELDEAETATVLGWPRGTVKSRLHRALGAAVATLLARPRTEPAPATRDDRRRRCDDGR